MGEIQVLDIPFQYFSIIWNSLNHESIYVLICFTLAIIIGYRQGISSILLTKDIDIFLSNKNSSRDILEKRRRFVERMQKILRKQSIISLLISLTIILLFYFLCNEKVCIEITSNFVLTNDSIQMAIYSTIGYSLSTWILKCFSEMYSYMMIYHQQELIFQDKLMIENIINKLGYPLSSKLKYYFEQEEKRNCIKNSCKIKKSIEGIDYLRYSAFADALRSFEWCPGCMEAMNKIPEYCDNSCLRRFRLICIEKNTKVKEDNDKMISLKLELNEQI